MFPSVLRNSELHTRLESGWTPSEGERCPDSLWPICNLGTVRMKQRHSEAIHSEGRTRSMSRCSCRVDDVTSRAKMVTMIVETHAGGGLGFGSQRNQELEFKRLFNLADRHHLADAPEERIAGSFHLESETKAERNFLRTLDPARAKVHRVVRAADADIF